MTSVTLKASDRFPVGTSVGAYLRSAWPGAERNPTPAAPSGAAEETQAVAADGSLTFTTLTNLTRYFAYAQVGASHRIVAFVPGSSGELRLPGGPTLFIGSSDPAGAAQDGDVWINTT